MIWRDLYSDIYKLQNEMNRLFSNSSNQYHRCDYPYCNIIDEGEQLSVRMPLPGVDASTLDIELENGKLHIKGERKLEQNEKAKYLRREREHGKFSKVLPIEQLVDPESVKANYTDGILNIVLNKAEAAKPRKIKVN